MISPTGEGESRVSAWLSQLCRMLPVRYTLFLSHPEYLGVPQSCLGATRNKEKGQWLTGIQGPSMELNKGLRFLLTASRIPPKSPATNLIGCITCGSSQIAYVHRQHTTRHPPNHVARSHACPIGGMCEPLKIIREHMQTVGSTSLDW